MANYLGREWKKEELLSVIGDPLQVAGARSFTYNEGKAEGVKGIQVLTGSGLHFTVLPGRGMDIPEAFYQGKSLTFCSGTGITSPAYFEEPGLGWLRSFFVGLLTTCGITNAGHPGEDMGEEFGIHGRVSNAAAEDLCIDQRWDGDEFIISLKGKMREVKAMFENVSLTRTIDTRLGMNGFRLLDQIENHGFDPQPLLMLYHINFGFPLLGPNARVAGPVVKTEPMTEHAKNDRGIEECFSFQGPEEGYEEKVFFHTLKADKDGNTFIALLNRDIGDSTPLGIVLRFNADVLPVLTEWKMPRKGFYVLGLEPGTATPIGRGKLRRMNKLPLIGGQEQRSIRIDFEVLETIEKIDAVEKEAESMS
jgi:hypothetical protein